MMGIGKVECRVHDDDKIYDVSGWSLGIPSSLHDYKNDSVPWTLASQVKTSMLVERETIDQDLPV